jgi:hypothetical protein
MRYAMLHAYCLACQRLFSSNPNHVPSLHGEPVCRDCMDQVNRHRKEKNLEPFPIHPEAYEPLDTREEAL